MSAIIVLKPGAREADIAPVAEARGWLLVGRAERTHDGFARTLWRSPDGERELLFQHDHRSEVRSLEVMGWDADEVAQALAPELPAWPLEALRAEAQSSDPLLALRALRTLTWAEWKAPSPEALAGVTALLSHPKEGARRAALRVALTGRWASLAAAVEERASEDPALEGLLRWTAEQLRALEEPGEE